MSKTVCCGAWPFCDCRKGVVPADVCCEAWPFCDCGRVS